jgi:hypothetical protein
VRSGTILVLGKEVREAGIVLCEMSSEGGHDSVVRVCYVSENEVRIGFVCVLLCVGADRTAAVF